MSEQRPYRSRKQKPCNACRKRKICCIRTNQGACQLCELRNIECVVEKEAPAKESESNPVTSAQQHTALSFVGLSGDLDPFILRHKQWLKDETQHSATWKCERVRKDPISPVYFTTSPSLHHLQAIDSSIGKSLLQNKGELLTKSYFDHVHSTYPLLSRREIEVIHNCHPTLKLSLCLIAGPFSLSYNDLNEEALAAHIYTALVDEVSHATLDTIEAFLLFAQRHAYAGRPPGSPGNSLEAGMIVPMAYNLGLNMNPKSWDIPCSEKKRRRKIWWAVYIHDKWSALALGRPSLIDDSQADVDPVVVTDFMAEEDEATAPLQYRTFVAMGHLTVILTDILTTFYTTKAKEKWLNHQCANELYDEYERLDQLLQTWSQEFLLPLLHHRASPDPLGSIILSYHTLQVILFRAVLLKLERLKFDLSPILPKAFIATSNVVSLVENLTMSQISAFWWPFSHASFSIVGSFMLSRVLSSTDPDSSEHWTAQFSKYHELLRTWAPKFPVARYAESSLIVLAD